MTSSVIASEAKQSRAAGKTGLLRRGACHRARIRATRWLLAMTTRYNSTSIHRALSAVTGSQLERAVLERIGLDHDDFLVRVAVMAFGRERDVAVDARIHLERVEIADDLFRSGAGILHRFRDQMR